jgi:hypothetical protein
MTAACMYQNIYNIPKQNRESTKGSVAENTKQDVVTGTTTSRYCWHETLTPISVCV